MVETLEGLSIFRRSRSLAHSYPAPVAPNLEVVEESTSIWLMN